MQDQELVGFIQACKLNNVPLSTPQLGSLVHRLWNLAVPEQWVRRRVRCPKPQLSYTACKALANKWFYPDVMEGVESFSGELKLFLESHSFTPEALFN